MNTMQRFRVVLASLVLTGLAFCNVAPAQTTATAPAKEKAKAADKTVPQSTINGLQDYLGRPAGKTQEEMMKNFTTQAKRMLKRGAEVEKQYAGAPNIYDVWMIMLQANMMLEQLDQTPEKADYAKQAEELATKISNSKAPIQSKLQADGILTMQKLKTMQIPAEKEKAIRALLSKYDNSPQAAMAYIGATVMAEQNQMADLANTLADEMEKKFKDDQAVQGFLDQSMGRSKFSGKVFAAELTKLDGSKLSLPKDLKGKVVVIDFWATWCGPCRASIPHLKTVYDKYKSKGVDVIGISLDEDRNALEKYVKEMKITWIITYSGKGWSDPTSQKYGIRGIPSVWVIGKDGKIVSTNARGNLEETIEKALKVDVK